MLLINNNLPEFIGSLDCDAMFTTDILEDNIKSDDLLD